jgi:hypothetical protein
MTCDVSQTCANNSIFNNNLSYNLNENFIINDYQVFTKSKGFRILHFNAQSIVQKIDEFRILCSILLPEILCICESWLTQLHTDFEFQIPGYIMCRKDRPEGRGGGLLTYAKINNNFEYEQVFIEDHVFSGIEFMCIRVQQKFTNEFYVSTLYSKPNNESILKTEFETVMNFFNNKELITLGDFNKNLNTNEFRKSWDQMITNNGFQQIIKGMTRVNENSSTLIDHIYVNKPQNISNYGVVIVNTSDHFPVFVSRKINFQLKRRKGTHFSITYRRWKNVDNDIISENLGKFKINENEKDVNKVCNDSTENIQNIIKNNIPVKQK